MKYIVFSYNMLTLCRALQYTNKQWGKADTTIIYSNIVTPLPERIKNDYKVVYIPEDDFNEKRGFDLIFSGCCLAKKVSDKVSNIINSNKEEYTVVVFRDNEVQEATVIDRISRKYPDRVHFCILEEGAGIYALKKVPIRYISLKKIIYRFEGVSLYSLMNRPQGENQKIEKIICTKPEILEKRYKNRKVVFEKMLDIFTEDLNSYMINALTGENGNHESFDYVFLTQPFKDFRGEYKKLHKKHEELLPKLFEILSAKGKTLIKPHPREVLDYSIFANKNVKIVSKEIKDVPFECLMQMYGKPQMISMYSSVSCGISTGKPSIYLWELFEIPGADKLFPNDYYANNNIVSCPTLDKFERTLI